MSNFLKSKKYYTKKELDDYVTRLMTNTENALMEQRERILELKKENEALTAKLALKKKREKASEQMQRANEQLETDTKKRCAKQLLKVKEFASNWADKFDELAEKYNIAETDMVDRLIIETDAISKPYNSISTGSADEQAINERFNALLARVKDRRKKEAMAKSAEENENDGEFSLEEALNPEDTLDAILKDLLG